MTKRKKYGRMPIKQQMGYILRILSNKNINYQKEEVWDYVDNTLTYEENKANILEVYLGGKEQRYEDETERQEAIEDFITQAERRDADRSSRAQMIDYHIRALKTYSPAQVIKNPELGDEWMENPNQTDIKGIDVSDDAKTTKQLKREKKRKEKEKEKENKIKIDKTKTIGIFGQKGSGKTYLTREIADKIPKNVIVFNTIGALNPKGTKMYEVDLKNFNKQAVIFSELTQKSKHNIGIDFSRLTKDEIVEFTEDYLSITPMKNKYIIVDEIADYVPQTGGSSKELERLIRHGRNTGNTFIFNTQRPAYITKNILNLVDVAIFFRLVWNRDIDVVKDLLNNLGKKNTTTQIREITNLGVGEYKIYKFGMEK